MADLAPQDARLIGISRRPPVRGEHLAADLGDPASWDLVKDAIEATLDTERPRKAVFLHFSGVIGPIGPLRSIDLDEHRSSVLLNSASGQVLGAAFVAAAAQRDIPGTLVLCSSPGGHKALEGIAQYGAGKVAQEHWARAAALDLAAGNARGNIFSVIPYGVDTAMVREAMDSPADVLPLGDHFRAAAAAEELASPLEAAREIWALVDSADTEPGAAIAVGAVPVEQS
ncbi:MAG: SDR family oxidoreductase [Actinobacteria bacterium]|nr:SDR family oxidoreductase [Actinomycetota bacterium]